MGCYNGEWVAWTKHTLLEAEKYKIKLLTDVVLSELLHMAAFSLCFQMVNKLSLSLFIFVRIIPSWGLILMH
jgi:hypothetical protein